MALNVIDIALAKSYTKKSIEGAGAIKGEDGFSPVVSTKETDSGTEVSITDSTHTETFAVKNGAGVPPGGETGQILVKSGEKDYESEWKDLPQDSVDSGFTMIQCTL